MNRDAYLTRGQAAKVTAVSPDVIGKWHARGWIDSTGQRRRLTVRRRPDGNLEYRLRDILDAERDTRKNPNCRRGSRRAPAHLRAASPVSAGEGASGPVGDRAHPGLTSALPDRLCALAA